ncbi:hypothetical protein BH20ACT5_BH20ACT5_02530 [soil metagenome]
MPKYTVCPWCHGRLVKRRFRRYRLLGPKWVWAPYCPPCRRRMGVHA